MKIWGVRGGPNGEYEQRFLSEGRIYLVLENFDFDLEASGDRDDLKAPLKAQYPEASDRELAAMLSAAWAFGQRLSKRDWVVLPSKIDNSVVHVGEIRSDWIHDEDLEGPLHHYRNVKWFAKDVPRDVFDRDVLKILNAPTDIFEVKNKSDELQYQMLAVLDKDAIASIRFSEQFERREPGSGRDAFSVKSLQGKDPSAVAEVDFPEGRAVGRVRRADERAMKWDIMAEQAVIEQEPLRAKRLLYGIAIIVTLLLVWSAFSEVDTVTRGTGKVIPSRQVQILGSQDGGVITEILVSEGDVVAKGQLLLKLDQTRSQANFGEARAELEGLQVKAARLQATVDGIEFVPTDTMFESAPEVVRQELRLFESSNAELAVQQDIAGQQLTQRQQELAELNARESQLATELDLADEELTKTRPMLNSGAVSEVEVLRLEREVNKAEGELKQTRAQIQRVTAAISEAEGKLRGVRLEFVNKAREQLTETVTRIKALREAAEGLSDRVRQTNLVSPVAGTVKQLYYNTEGGVVLPGRDIVELIPADDTLLVEVRIPPKDIAFLAPGQVANVKVTAYDFVVYGGLKGRVEQIGVDTVVDEDGNPFYEVRVRTEQADFGPDKPIIPGMTVEADILTGKKTILAYIMKPVLRAHQRALSER